MRGKLRERARKGTKRGAKRRERVRKGAKGCERTRKGAKTRIVERPTSAHSCIPAGFLWVAFRWLRYGKNAYSTNVGVGRVRVCDEFTQTLYRDQSRWFRYAVRKNHPFSYSTNAGRVSSDLYCLYRDHTDFVKACIVCSMQLTRTSFSIFRKIGSLREKGG